jgi:histidinol dehydrogenase
VRLRGDEAIASFAGRFGDKPPRAVPCGGEILASSKLPDKTKHVLASAAERIKKFAEQVMSLARPVSVAYSEYNVGFEFKPVARAACYIPAGRYPLPSTALMTAVTAKVAGVKEVVIFSPDLRDEILYAGALAGIDQFYEIGGAQAVAAAAYGTDTIMPVDIIVGPGNAFVTEAKRQVFGDIGIDMLAGPSEIAIIADGGANPKWIALDLLSQAEHDPNARAYLLTTDEVLAKQVAAEIETAFVRLALPDFVKLSLEKSAILKLPTLDACVQAANRIAPEHLHLHVAEPESLKPLLTNYGALFMGYNATVPYGDYMAGPNHTLPTSRAARFSGGLNPFIFLRGQSWLKVDAPAPELAELTAAFADLEGLTAHSAAASARIR